MFGALPVGFESFQGPPHAFVGDRPGDDPLLETDLSGQFQRPGAALLAKIVRAAVQQVFEPFGSFLREGGAQSMGTRRSFLQDMQSRGVELMDHVAHALVVAAQLARDRWGTFPTRRCSQDLAAAHHKGIRRTQSRLDLALFVLGERSDKNGCSHTW